MAIPIVEAIRVWVRIAMLSIGGPAGQIAVMHRILVEEKKWISEERFLHAMNYCMLLPGPEAQQLATYIGWLLHRTLGGLIAGILFIVPGFISILVLSILYAGFHDIGFVEAFFYGIKPAVLAVVIEAVFRIGKRVLKNAIMVTIAWSAFIAIFFFNVPFPAIILSAGLIGYLGWRFTADTFLVVQEHTANFSTGKPAVDALIDDHALDHTKPSLAHSIRIILLCLFLWFAPILILISLYGMADLYVQEGLFFSKAAVVTFGGAYAVLAYIAQQAVHTYGWLNPGEMLDGLGMAETTPGPLIQVVQFVGFMGAYGNPGELPPMIAGMLGAILTTWVTFVPCFLWIFLGAPYIEALRGKKSLTAALSAVTAAVVGVILNLSVWFALHTLFSNVSETHLGPLRVFVPEWHSIDVAASFLAIAALTAIFRFKVGMIPIIMFSAFLGMIVRLVF